MHPVVLCPGGDGDSVNYVGGGLIFAPSLNASTSCKFDLSLYFDLLSIFLVFEFLAMELDAAAVAVNIVSIWVTLKIPNLLINFQLTACALTVFWELNVLFVFLVGLVITLTLIEMWVLQLLHLLVHRSSKRIDNGAGSLDLHANLTEMLVVNVLMEIGEGHIGYNFVD